MKPLIFGAIKRLFMAIVIWPSLFPPKRQQQHLSSTPGIKTSDQHSNVEAWAYMAYSCMLLLQFSFSFFVITSRINSVMVRLGLRKEIPPRKTWKIEPSRFFWGGAAASIWNQFFDGEDCCVDRSPFFFSTNSLIRD